MTPGRPVRLHLRLPTPSKFLRSSLVLGPITMTFLLHGGKTGLAKSRAVSTGGGERMGRGWSRRGGDESPAMRPVRASRQRSVRFRRRSHCGFWAAEKCGRTMAGGITAGWNSQRHGSTPPGRHRRLPQMYRYGIAREDCSHCAFTFIYVVGEGQKENPRSRCAPVAVVVDSGRQLRQRSSVTAGTCRRA